MSSNMATLTFIEGIIPGPDGPTMNTKVDINRDGKMNVKRKIHHTDADYIEAKGQLNASEIRLLTVELRRLFALPCSPTPGSDDIYHCDTAIKVTLTDGTVWSNYQEGARPHDPSRIRPSDSQVDEFSSIMVAIKQLVKKVPLIR